MTTGRNDAESSGEIVGNTVKSMVAFISRSGIPFGKSFSEAYKKSPENIGNNLKQLNCEKRIFVDSEKIYGIETWGNLIITSSRSSIKAWNSVTGEIAWTYSGNFDLGEKLWVTDNEVICAGRETTGKGYYGKSFILVIDAETGKASSIIKYPVHPDFVTVANNEIIGRISSSNSDGYIKCWDLSGNATKEIPSSNPSSALNKLLANENYIVDINDKNITLINRKNDTTVDLTAVETISSATISNNLLICGLSCFKSSSSDIIVVDMEQGQQIYEHKTKGLFDREYLGKTVWPGCGEINSVVAKNNMVFMLHNGGSKSCCVVAVDLALKSGTVLEIPKPYSPYISLDLQDQCLFIKSHEYRHQPATSSLCIWDIDKMEKVRKMDIPEFYSAKWDKGNLLVSSGESLIKNDFKVLHQKGEILVGNSSSQDQLTYESKRF